MKKTAAKAVRREPPPPKPKTPWPDSIARSASEWAATILILLFGTTMILQAFVVPTASMERTVLIGDHLFVDKLAYSPPGRLFKSLLPYQEVRRGDIVVFRYPLDLRQNYVKRVVGVPGDRLRIVNKQLFLNGKPAEEPYKQHSTPYLDSYRDNFPSIPNVRLPERAQAMLAEQVKDGELVVPPNHYFAMGDNRDNSEDSRYWGFVPRENIVGKPVLIWYSYDAPSGQLSGGILSFDHLRDLIPNFFSKTRWSRIFRLIRGHNLN